MSSKNDNINHTKYITTLQKCQTEIFNKIV